MRQAILIAALALCAAPCAADEVDDAFRVWQDYQTRAETWDGLYWQALDRGEDGAVEHYNAWLNYRAAEVAMAEWLRLVGLRDSFEDWFIESMERGY